MLELRQLVAGFSPLRPGFAPRVAHVGFLVNSAVVGYVSVGHAVAQLVEALRYKPEGRGFYSRW